MKQRFFLVSKTQYFYDGHGCPDSGATTLEVTSDKEFYELDASKTYDDDLQEVDEDAEYFEQDGYNCCVTELTFKEITEQEAEKYTKIIADYLQLEAQL